MCMCMCVCNVPVCVFVCMCMCVCVCIMYMFVLVARDDVFTLNYSAQHLWIIANVGNKLKSVSCIYLVIRAYYLIGTWI